MNQPSPELIARVEQSGRDCWKHLIDREAEVYERGKLAELGVIPPPHSLHDYSATGTRVVIEVIRIRLESAKRIWARQGSTSFGIGYQLAPFWAALKVEEAHLAQLMRPLREIAA